MVKTIKVGSIISVDLVYKRVVVGLAARIWSKVSRAWTAVTTRLIECMILDLAIGGVYLIACIYQLYCRTPGNQYSERV